jgi:hypothetical protein
MKAELKTHQKIEQNAYALSVQVIPKTARMKFFIVVLGLVNVKSLSTVASATVAPYTLSTICKIFIFAA